MVVAIIICCIKEVLTAEGGRGHATQHLAANGFCMGRHIRKNMHTIIYSATPSNPSVLCACTENTNASRIQNRTHYNMIIAIAFTFSLLH